MSEGKKVLVVSTAVDRLVLLEQLKAYGIDCDVAVDGDKVGSMVSGLLSLPTAREETLKALEGYTYAGDYATASNRLLDRIKEEIHKFSSCQMNSVALRDLILNSLSKELGGKPFSWTKGTSDEAPAPDTTLDRLKEVGIGILSEILNELKGVKETVVPLFPKGFYHWVEYIRNNPEVLEQGIKQGIEERAGSVPELVAQLKARSAFSGEGLPHAWGVIAPDTKERFLKLLSAALTDQSSESVHPALAVTKLSPADRLGIMELLNPKFTVKIVDRRDYVHAMSTHDSIFKMLIEALKEDGLGHIQIFGLNTLRAQDRELMIDKLSRISGDKQPIKVSGWEKELFISGISKALAEAHDAQVPVIIEGLWGMKKETVAELVQHIQSTPVRPSEPFVKRPFTPPTVEDIPKSITAGNVAFAVSILTNLWERQAAEKGIDIAQPDLLDHLLGQVASQYGRMYISMEDTPNNPIARNAGDTRCLNTALALDHLVSEWVVQALSFGIKIDKAALLNYLICEQVKQLEQLDTRRGVRYADDWLLIDPLKLKDLPVGIVIGGSTFNCSNRDDGSFEITAQLGDNNTATVIVNKDGTIVIKNPGYLG